MNPARAQKPNKAIVNDNFGKVKLDYGRTRFKEETAKYVEYGRKRLRFIIHHQQSV